jgi:hypothetical protein
MDSGAAQLQSQRVEIDANERRRRHRRVAEERPEQPPARGLEAPQGQRGDVGLPALLQVADRNPESLAGLCHRDVVGLLHRLEGRDMHPLGEGRAQRLARSASVAVEHVGRPLPPGRVGDLGDDAVELALGGVEEEERDRVEADPEVARIGEQPDRPLRPSPEPRLHQVASPLRQRAALSREVVAVAETRRRRATSRPQRNPIQQLRELVQVQQRQQDPVAEGVRNLAEAPVGDPSLVDRRAIHAALANSSETASIRSSARTGSCGCGSGPRPPSLSATRSADQTPSS